MFFVGEAYLDVGMLAAAMVVSTLQVIFVYVLEFCDGGERMKKV
jgi:hypothetical protein